MPLPTATHTPTHTATPISGGETVIYLGDPIVAVGSGVLVDGSTATIIAAGTYRALGTLTNGWMSTQLGR